MKGTDLALLALNRWDKVLLKQLHTINPEGHMATQGFKIAVFDALLTGYLEEREMAAKAFYSAPHFDMKLQDYRAQLIEPAYHMRVNAKAHSSLVRHFENLRRTTDDLIGQMRTSGQLKALKDMHMQHSRSGATNDGVIAGFRELHAQLSRLRNN